MKCDVHVHAVLLVNRKLGDLPCIADVGFFVGVAAIVLHTYMTIYLVFYYMYSHDLPCIAGIIFLGDSERFAHISSKMAK